MRETGRAFFDNNNDMNIGAFLHVRKQQREDSLPLPLAPSYLLPQHLWFFSSPSCVPLRKRKQNSSPLAFLSPSNTLQQQLQQGKDSDRLLLGVFEQHNYLSSQLKHLFGTIRDQCNSRRAVRNKVRCQCEHVPEQSCVGFVISRREVREGIRQHRNNRATNRLEQCRDENVNWFEFARHMVNAHTQQPFYGQDQLHLFRMPQSTLSNPSSNIFSIVYSCNYLVFNSSHTMVNQHMKGKAVQLAQIVHQQLQTAIWKGIQEQIENAVDEIADLETFIKKAKEMAQINSFRLWFYKKESNNEIYVLTVSDLGFKGVSCQLYKDLSFASQETAQKVELPILDFLQGQTPQAKDYHMLMHRVRTATLNSPVGQLTSTASANKLKLQKINNANRQLSSKTLDLIFPSDEHSLEVQPTETQCQCCKNLLMSNEIANEIIGKHIDEIRYLRQFKMGKKEHEPYDFVKVCEECYKVFIRHQKRMKKQNSMKNNEGEGKRKAVSFYEYKNKNSKHNNSKNNNSNDKNSHNKNENVKMSKNSSKEALRNRSFKSRVVSQFNNITDHNEGSSVEKQEQNIGREIRPSASLPAKNKSRKTKTTHTSNSETVDMESQSRTKVVRPQGRLERVLTDYQKDREEICIEEEELPKTKSTRGRKSRLPPKCHNLINRIILSSQVSEEVLQVQQQQPQESEQLYRPPLALAIEEYQSLSRPSFKKLLFRNRRGYLRQVATPGCADGTLG